jgi:pimeloyl-ACP methyl ester carboxylesterase
VPSIGDEAAVRERGWGGIGEATYTGYLLWLEQHLNQVSPNPARWTDFYHDDVTIGTAPKPGAQPKLSPGVKIGIVGQPFSAEMPFKSLRTDDLLARSRFYMPVHAYGYNWLASCTDAGLGLKAFIEEVIKLYDRDPFWCRQVVLVTHSMGGLVARYCATLPGMADKIAGVVHGVMPTNGAAVAYRRCKVGAGDEGSGLLEAFGYLSFFGVLGSWKNFKEAFSARVIGNSGRDVAAFFPQAPGALQLLPTKDYFQGWLKFQYKGQSVASWPASDPYEEIYRRGDNWWGLVREEWLRPASGTFFSWSDFLTNVDRAEAFHESIRHKYHAFTYIIYGCDSKQKSFETVTWKISDGDSPESFEDRGIEKLLAMSPSVVCWDWLPTADESKRKDRYSHSTPMFSGSYSKQQSFVNSSWIVSKGIAIDPVEKHGVEKVLAMSPREVSMDGSPTAFVVGNISGYSSTTPMFAGSKWLFHCETQDGSGDGTVPVSSGRAPLHDNCVAVKQQFAMRGFDHQGAFDDDQVRNASLYSITKIAAAAKKP